MQASNFLCKEFFASAKIALYVNFTIEVTLNKAVLRLWLFVFLLEGRFHHVKGTWSTAGTSAVTALVVAALAALALWTRIC